MAVIPLVFARVVVFFAVGLAVLASDSTAVFASEPSVVSSWESAAFLAWGPRVASNLDSSVVSDLELATVVVAAVVAAIVTKANAMLVKKIKRDILIFERYGVVNHHSIQNNSNDWAIICWIRFVIGSMPDDKKKE